MNKDELKNIEHLRQNWAELDALLRLMVPGKKTFDDEHYEVLFYRAESARKECKWAIKEATTDLKEHQVHAMIKKYLPQNAPRLRLTKDRIDLLYQKHNLPPHPSVIEKQKAAERQIRTEIIKRSHK